MIIIIFGSLIAFVISLYFIIFHIYLYYMNLTTYEFLNPKKREYGKNLELFNKNNNCLNNFINLIIP